MHPNKMAAKCPNCGIDALVEVVPDGFDDAPPSFTITVACKGPCEKVYMPMTPQQMTEKTGLPATGWS